MSSPAVIRYSWKKDKSDMENFTQPPQHICLFWFCYGIWEDPVVATPGNFFFDILIILTWFEWEVALITEILVWKWVYKPHSSTGWPQDSEGCRWELSGWCFILHSYLCAWPLEWVIDLLILIWVCFSPSPHCVAGLRHGRKSTKTSRHSLSS